MARLDSKGNYVANKNIKVAQGTVDKLKTMGMSKALAHANSGSADSEFVEAARRFYGTRVTGSPQQKAISVAMTKSLPGKQSATVTKTAERSAVIGEAKAAPSVSKNYKPGRKEA